MSDTLSSDSETLIDEITRYLAVVDAFRAAGSEPAWLPEAAPFARAPELTTRGNPAEKSAH